MGSVFVVVFVEKEIQFSTTITISKGGRIPVSMVILYPIKEMLPNTQTTVMITISIVNITALYDLKKINSIIEAIINASITKNFNSFSTFLEVTVLIYGKPE